MQKYDYFAGMEGLREEPRADVREEVYIRLLMRMFSMTRDEAKRALEVNGGVDKFAALVNKQTPESAWKNLQKAATQLEASQVSGFDPDMY